MKLIIMLILQRLEYMAVVWSSNRTKDIRKIERIQRAATKMVLRLKDLSEEAGMEKKRLLTVEEGRGDMIVVFRAIKGIDRVAREDLLLWLGGVT